MAGELAVNKLRFFHHCQVSSHRLEKQIPGHLFVRGNGLKAEL
jgi:hypothetical protein